MNWFKRNFSVRVSFCLLCDISSATCLLGTSLGLRLHSITSGVGMLVEEEELRSEVIMYLSSPVRDDYSCSPDTCPTVWIILLCFLFMAPSRARYSTLGHLHLLPRVKFKWNPVWPCFIFFTHILIFHRFQEGVHVHWDFHIVDNSWGEIWEWRSVSFLSLVREKF